ncbi:MAG: hypothetical protein GX174_05490 [Lentisphaerae bacterium]|jgi:hypothetical protein|nr:hypothetical protein [Lentisphaerota bacterium]
MPFLTPSSAVRLRRAAALAVLLASGGALPAAEAVVNAFAGSETLVICRSSFVPRAGEEVWFRVVRDHRTVAAGTVRAGGDGRIALPVALPGIRPGVALPLEVTLRAGSEQGRVLPGGGTLWALAEQPLPPGRNPAAPRAIRLYDPVGRTEAAFRSISLPFESVVRLAALAAMTNTTLVVGEDLALESERGLWEALMASVAQGNRILLLAPADGVLRPPADWQLLMAGPADRLLRAPPRGGAAYKLDLREWPPAGAVRIRFRLAAIRDQVVFEAGSAAGCEAVRWTDAASGGSFTACGLGIIASWETAPAARWLLVELLNEEK